MSLDSRIAKLEQGDPPKRDIVLRIVYFETVRCEESGEKADIPIPCDEYVEGEFRTLPSGARLRMDWPKRDS
jgi:hypothetical protein